MTKKILSFYEALPRCSKLPIYQPHRRRLDDFTSNFEKLQRTLLNLLQFR